MRFVVFDRFDLGPLDPRPFRTTQGPSVWFLLSKTREESGGGKRL